MRVRWSLGGGVLRGNHRTILADALHNLQNSADADAIRSPRGPCISDIVRFHYTDRRSGDSAWHFTCSRVGTWKCSRSGMRWRTPVSRDSCGARWFDDSDRLASDGCDMSAGSDRAQPSATRIVIVIVIVIVICVSKYTSPWRHPDWNIMHDAAKTSTTARTYNTPVLSVIWTGPSCSKNFYDTVHGQWW